MSKAKKLSLSVIFQFISIAVTGMIGILVVPIIINLIGQEYYGVLEIILSLMFINFFFELGMGSTLLRFIPVYEKEGPKTLNEFLWTYLYFKSILALIATIVIFIIGYNFNHFFNLGHADAALVKNAVYIFALGILVSNIATFFSNTLKGLQRFDFAIIPEIISQVFFLILIYILSQKVAKNVDILNISFLMFILRPLIRIMTSMFFIKKIAPYIKFSPTKPQKRFFKESLNFLKGMSFIALFAQFYNKAPKLILGAMLNPVSVAYWGIAERLKNPIQQINSSLVRPLIPMASSMDLEQEHDIKAVIIRITKIHFLLIGGITSFVLLYINPFIELWLGVDYLYVGNIARIWFFPLILPNASVLLMFYYAKGKTKLSQNMNIFNSSLGLALGSILVLKFDALGMAYGLSISVTLISVVYFYYLCKEFHLSFWSLFKGAYLTSYSVVIISAIISILMINYTQIDSWIKLILSVAISIIIYLILIFLSLSRPEKDYYNNFLKGFSFISNPSRIKL